MALLTVSFALFAIVALEVNPLTTAKNVDYCDDSFVNLTAVESEFGWMNPIYNLAQSICRDMQDTSEEYYETLSEVFEELTNGTLQVNSILSLVRHQVGATILIIIGLVSLVAMPISGIFFCCCRCCGRCGAKGKRLSKCALCIHLLIVITGTAFITASAIIYGISVQNTSDNVDNLANITTDISKDLENVLTAASSNVQCEVDQTFEKFFDGVSATIHQIPNETFSDFERKYGYDEIKRILSENANMPKNLSYAFSIVSNAISNLTALASTTWKDAQEVARVSSEADAVNISLSEVTKYFNDIYNELNTTFADVDKKITDAKTQVEESLASAQNSLDKVQNDIKGISSTINTTVNDIKTEIDNVTSSLQDIQDTISSSPIKNGIVHGIQALVIIPCMLVVIPAVVALICGLARLPMKESRPSQRPYAFHCGGIIAMMGVFCGFCFGWIVILVASLSFIGGYGAEMVCRPLFNDPHMHIFQHMRLFNFEIPPIFGNASTNIGFGEVLTKCSEHSSIFMALNGNITMDVSAIMQQANLDHYKQQAIDEFKKYNFNYTVNPQNNILLENATSLLEQALSKFETTLNATKSAAGNDSMKVTQVENAEQSLREAYFVIDNLIGFMNKTLNEVKDVIETSSNSGNFIDEGVATITEVFNETIANVTQLLYDAKEQLLIETFDCHPLYGVWQTIGAMLCDVVGKPLQGVWASAGLAALFINVSIVGLVLTATYLKRTTSKYDRSKTIQYDRPRSIGYDRSNFTLRRPQYDYGTKVRMARWIAEASAETSAANRKSPFVVGESDYEYVDGYGHYNNYGYMQRRIN